MVAAGSKYLRLLGAATAVAALAVELLPADWRQPVRVALLAAVVLQAPLGWWLVETVGTPRFLVAWTAGMLARLTLVGVMGLIVVPATGMRAEAVLLPLVTLLMAFVVLEGVVLMIQHSRVEIR